MVRTTRVSSEVPPPTAVDVDNEQLIPEITKQVSILLPLSAWKILRETAARRHVPITELCRRILAPELCKLRTANQKPRGEDDE